jgi:hypothetical protein
VVRTVEAPGGMLEIFRGRPGFQSYELIETGAGLVSVSHWDSSEQADAATRVAASWVADHIDDLVKLQQSDTGEVVLSSLAVVPREVVSAAAGLRPGARSMPVD